MVERFPIDPKSGYKRMIVSFNKDMNYRIEKVEYYDRKNAKLKTLTYKNYQQYKSKYWRAGEMHMVNHQTNKETTLLFTDYEFGVELSDTDFSQNALKRAGN